MLRRTAKGHSAALTVNCPASTAGGKSRGPAKQVRATLAVDCELFFFSHLPERTYGWQRRRHLRRWGESGSSQAGAVRGSDFPSGRVALRTEASPGR